LVSDSSFVRLFGGNKSFCVFLVGMCPSFGALEEFVVHDLGNPEFYLSHSEAQGGIPRLKEGTSENSEPPSLHGQNSTVTHLCIVKIRSLIHLVAKVTHSCALSLHFLGGYGGAEGSKTLHQGLSKHVPMHDMTDGSTGRSDFSIPCI